MNKDKAPFEVICVDDKPRYGKFYAPWLIKKDEKYTVKQTCEPFNDGEIWYELEHQPFVAYPALHFRRIEPSYEDATAEILEKFKPFEGVEVDQPVKKIKEPVLN